MNEMDKRKVADMLSEYGIYANFRKEFKSFSDAEQRLMARVLYGLRETDVDPDGETLTHKTFEEFVDTELMGN